MDIYSNTIVKNGKPFIIPVLKQVEPYMKKMFVTVSKKSTDGTYDLVKNLEKKLKGKLVVDIENVKHPSLLTQERQKQLDKVPMGKWVLFLDADDWWPKESMEQMMMFLNNTVDGLSINPYQVVTKKFYDSSWRNKYFLKWFRNDKGVHYRYPWPRDMIFKDDKIMYWRKNEKCPRIAVRFFHLENLMNWRFRDQPEFAEYKAKLGSLVPYDKGWEEDVDKIYEHVKRNK
jgi:glycosyltransferase involved in cell wall biosynthesis